MAPVIAKPRYGMPSAITARPATTPRMRPSAAPRGNSAVCWLAERPTSSTMPAPMMMSAAISGNSPLSGPAGPTTPSVHA